MFSKSFGMRSWSWSSSFSFPIFTADEGISQGIPQRGPFLSIKFSSQKKSRFASDFLRRGNRASWGLKKSRDCLGSCKKAPPQPQRIARLLCTHLSTHLGRCWLIRFDLRDPKPQPLDAQNVDEQHHYDHGQLEDGIPLRSPERNSGNFIET